MWSNIHKFYLPIWLACWSWMQVLVALEPTIGVDQVLHYQPEQVHLSFGDKVSDIVVTWSTRGAINETVAVQVSTRREDKAMVVFGSSRQFVDGGPKRRTQYIHKVVLRGLEAGTKYLYRCGFRLGWSRMFSFTGLPDHAQWQPRLAIYGDLGLENAQSVRRLREDVLAGMYDAVLHVGDFAYDMDTDDAQVGDAFMRLIEPIAANVSYMTCPGNHEEKYNFSNYRHRFNMPGDSDGLWYSFNMGPVHFVSFSTEVYYFVRYGLKLLTKQFEWLENDLREANKPANRANQPWIITYGHRPMYCSDDKEYDCDDQLQTFIRQGWPALKWFGLERLFYEHGVDVELFGHEHFYTRLWPIYDFEVRNGSTEAPYTNARAPIHIITGSAGCRERLEPFSKVLPEWNAFHSVDYGYTRMQAFNRSHIHFEQVSDDQNGTVIDSFWIIKDKHGAYKDPLSPSRLANELK